MTQKIKLKVTPLTNPWFQQKLYQGALPHECISEIILEVEGGGLSKDEYVDLLAANSEDVTQIIEFADTLTPPDLTNHINKELLTNEVLRVFSGSGSDISAMKAARQYYIDNDLPVPIELENLGSESVDTGFSFFDTLIFNTYAVVRGSIGIIVGDWGPRFNPVPVSEFIKYCEHLYWTKYVQFHTVIDILCYLDAQLSVPINKDISRKMEKNK